MTARRYYLADVFTATPMCGNPLAVVCDADDLDAVRMQQIAREFNLSETTFVSAGSAPGRFRVRIFAPSCELPFAGHPTVGTAHVLAHSGMLPLVEGDNAIVLEEEIGDVPVRIKVAGGHVVHCEFTAPASPQFGEALSGESLSAILGVFPEDIVDGLGGPDAASCGVPFHLVQLNRLSALSTIRFDTAAYHLWGEQGWAQSFCVYVRDPAQPDRLHVRVFSPAFGFLEDPGTGAAAAALAAGLARQEARPDGCLRWNIWQGYDMGRPSQLHIEAERSGGRTTAIRVGGAAVVIGEGQLHV